MDHCDHCEEYRIVQRDTEFPQFCYCQSCYYDYILPALLETVTIHET